MSGHNDAYYNMALDEALLESYLPISRTPTLRIYGWKPEAFSFGVAQDPEDNLNIDECRRRGMPFVRRMTGGGVLFHSGDISYSVTASLEDLGAAGSVVRSYRTICAFLVEMYRGLGLGAAFAADAGKDSKGAPGRKRMAPDLCMASNEKHDILVNGKKLGGNAQRRMGNVVLQHGSIPLKATLARSRDLVKDPARVDTLDATSLGEAIGRDITYDEAAERLAAAFEKTFGCRFIDGAKGVIARRPKGPMKQSYQEELYYWYDCFGRHGEQGLPRNDTLTGAFSSALTGAFTNLLINKYLTPEWNLERRDNSKKAAVAQQEDSPR